ncbi:MAG: bacillithiol biosynthesis cysteine-adding enzyme BshC [Melioribacteraceae bacterium]|nr:bacillithiol biosynthesis cysteine-adding enzyme BshC [Melioribacteraceae bacterium]
MFINFSDIPGHQNLFLDYLYEFENVEKYFRYNFRDTNSFSSLFQKISESERADKKSVVNAINQFYSAYKPSKKTKVNIELLGKDKTVAVVTGQQLGILGGPLYTFYKTITAIKLASSLKEKYDDYNFVPVFWLEGDDHDFEEVTELNLINQKNELQKFIYNDNKPEDFNRGNIGRLAFNEGIENFIQEVKSELRETEFSKNVFELFEDSYKLGNTFKKAFSNLIFNLFDEEGLIIFDPQQNEIKNLLKPIFKKELSNFEVHANEVVKISADLEEVYHSQVKVKPINLFYSDNNGRYSIEPEDDLYRLKGKRQKFTLIELLDEIENYPDKFSANVLLRPITQDYLLPTGFYVAGPSEISYFAQVMPLYNKFGISEPVIYPRSSVTILEKNIKGVLEKYELNIEDIFVEEKLLNNRVLNQVADIRIDDLLNEDEHQIAKAMDNIKEKLFGIDPTLKDLSDKTYQKIKQGLDTLKSKAENAQERKHDVALRQIKKASISLYPNNNLQERELNWLYFANKYGMDIIKWIFDEVAINKFEHQVIEL